MTKVTGTATVLANVARLPQATAPDESLETLKSAAEPIRQHAVDLAPYDVNDRDGIHLRDHLIVAEREDPTKGTVAVYVGTDRIAKHGHLVELGTIHMAAQPFLRPAFDMGQAETRAILRRRVWESIRKAIR